MKGNSPVKEEYRRYLAEIIPNNYLVYLPFLVGGLLGFCYTDIYVRNLPELIYTRIGPIVLGLFLMIIRLTKLKNHNILVRVFNTFFSLSMIVMGLSFVSVTMFTVHYKAFLSPLIVSIMLVFFFIKGRNDILLVFILPLVAFIPFLIFYLKPEREIWHELLNPLAIYVGVFVVSLTNEKSRYKEFYYKRQLANEKDKTDRLLKQSVIKNEELQQHQEEILTINDQLEDKRNEMQVNLRVISELHSDLEKKNNSLTESMNYARRIQNAVLPATSVMKKVFSDYFVLNKPSDIVSGDFYWVHQIGNLSMVAVADCTGHGIPGGFMSMLAQSLVNEVANNVEAHNPSDILSKVKAKLKMSLHRNTTSKNHSDGFDIALCVYNRDTEMLHYSGAFLPLLVIRGYEQIFIKGDRMPIGTHLREDADFTNHEIKVLTNDSFYLFTDGFQDQIGGPNNKRFLSSRLKEYLLEISGKPFYEQKFLLDGKFNSWKGSNIQVDDVMVLGFKF